MRDTGRRGSRRVLAAFALAAGLSLSALAAPASAACGGLLQPPCPQPLPTNSDGSAQVNSSLGPLSAPVAGQPLFTRLPNGHKPIGFNNNAIEQGTATPQEVAMLYQRIGGTISREGIHWTFVEGTPGVYQWAHYDQRYKALVEAGVRPLLTILWSPNWAVAPPHRSSSNLAGESHYPPDAAHRDEFASFAAALARRYPLAAAIEIWNEPNLEVFWPEPTNPEEYAELLAAAHAAVKQVRPGMRVLGGALSNKDVDDASGLSLQTFSQRMLDHGAVSSMDGLSFHPYPVYRDPVPYFRGTFQDLHAVLSQRPEWLSLRLVADEVGLSRFDDNASTQENNTEDQQRDVLVARYDEIDGDDPTIPLTDHVDAVMFHTTVEPQVTPTYGWVYQKNVFGEFYPEKVFCAFAAKMGVVGGCGPMKYG